MGADKCVSTNPCWYIFTSQDTLQLYRDHNTGCQPIEYGQRMQMSFPDPYEVLGFQYPLHNDDKGHMLKTLTSQEGI